MINCEIQVLKDFDGFFESLTKELLAQSTNPSIKVVKVQALPFIPYEFGYEVTAEGEVTITWYSACRVFGRSTKNEELIEALNQIDASK